MAAKYPENIQTFLECSICLEPFIRPKILPCIHTFCERCLQEHITTSGKQGQFNCPSCRFEVVIPTDAAAGIPNNFFMQNLIDAFPMGTTVQCDICSKVRNDATVATSMCIQCVEHLCSTCAEGHTKYNSFTIGHKVVSLEDVRSGSFLKEIKEHQRSFCRLHKKEELKLYCKSCQQTMCLLCKALDHGDHKVTTLEDAASKVNDQLHAANELIVAKTQFLESVVAYRKKMRDGISLLTEEQENEIKEWSKLEIQKIHCTETILLQDLKEKEIVVRKQAEMALDEAESQLVTFKSTTDYTERMIEHANAAEKLQQCQELNNRLDQLNKVDMPNSSKEPEYKFVLPATPEETAEISVYHKTVIHPQFSCNKETLKKLLLPKAQLVKSFSTKLEEEEVPKCCGITVDGENFYTTDWVNKKVKAFDKTGLFQCLIGDGLVKLPVGITTFAQECLLITDYSEKALIMFNKNTRCSEKTIKNLFEKEGFVETNNKNEIILAADKEKISVLNTAGVVTKTIDKNCVGLSKFTPRYVTTNMKNDMIVSDWESKSVHVLDATGKRLFRYKPDGEAALQYPEGVCVDQLGNILVVVNTGSYTNEDSRGLVHLVSSTGEHLALLVTENDGLKYSTGICITGPGEFAVLELEGCVKIYKYLN